MVIENPRDPDSPGRKAPASGCRTCKRRLAALHGDAASLRVQSSSEAFRVEVRLPASAR